MSEEQYSGIEENCANPEWRPARLELPRGFVYIILCRDGGGPLYAKVGYSIKPRSRVAKIIGESPIPAQKILIFATETDGAASRLETAIHHHYDGCRTRGEWFRFDLNDKGHKALFNEGLQIAIQSDPDHERKWFNLSIDYWDRAVRKNKRAWDENHAALKRIQRAKAASGFIGRI